MNGTGNISILKCDRCMAEAQARHPIHGFIVRLEKVHYKNRKMHVCQRCKVQIEIKMTQAAEAAAGEKGQIRKFFSKMMGMSK